MVLANMYYHSLERSLASMDWSYLIVQDFYDGNSPRYESTHRQADGTNCHARSKHITSKPLEKYLHSVLQYCTNATLQTYSIASRKITLTYESAYRILVFQSVSFKHDVWPFDRLPSRIVKFFKIWITHCQWDKNLSRLSFIFTKNVTVMTEQ